MKVKLIQPRTSPRPMDTSQKLHMAPPLGLLTVAAIFAGSMKSRWKTKTSSGSI